MVSVVLHLKCYETLPWRGLFGMMAAAGILQSVVACFADFCKRLRRRFSYGQLEGAPWQAANGAAQSCPACPDELNIFGAIPSMGSSSGCGGAYCWFVHTLGELRG